MCGPTEIDGYAFCLGIGSLKGFYEAHADLQRLIHSVTYLIRGAIFRPSYVVSGPGRVSQGIGSLGELIDMYHSHEATQRHDKVYALLGMSSDDLSKVDLLPNYNVPWEELLQRLTKYLLSKKISVETWGDEEIAVIKSKGFILGKVSSVQGGIDRDGRQGVDGILKNMSGKSGYLGEWSSHWTLQVSAKPIRIGDFICLLEGTSKPTIIRLCENYWTIILITTTPPQTIRNGSKYIEWPKTWPVVKLPTRDLRLVWDWENSPEKSQNLVEYKESQAHSKEGARLWSLALVLEDGEEYKKAEKKFREAMEVYEIAFEEERLGTLKSEFGPALLSWAANLDVVGSQYSRTPLSWAAEGGHKTIVELLLQTGEADANLKDMDGWAPLSRAAEGGYLAVIEQLLQAKAKVNAAAGKYNGRTALQGAAGEGYLAVVERLLQEKAEVNAAAAAGSGRTALQAATGGGYFAIVERLLQEKAEVNAAAAAEYDGRTALQAAAEGGHFAIVERLLQEKADVNAAAARETRRNALQAAAEGGHLAVVERLLQEKADVNAAAADMKGRTALQAAAGGGHLAVVERLLLEKADVNAAAGYHCGRTALQAAAEGGYLAVVERLLPEKADVNAVAGAGIGGRTALQAAAERGYLAVVERLLQEKADVNAAATDIDGRTALQAAAKEGGYLTIIKCLRDAGAIK
jgi:ankyrin repeat protein